MRTQLTILFDDPFWVGVFERDDGAQYTAARVVFGAEPSGAELYDWMLRHYPRGVEFGPPQASDDADRPRRINPKRAQREAQRATEARGVSTKAQEAMRLALEANKQDRRVRTREEREAEKQRQFELRQLKRKEKHRGH